MIGRHVAGTELDLGHGAIITAQEGDQQLGEITARVLVDPAHDAEVDRHDAALAIDEGVAAMHVGMEEAVAEHLIEERLGAFAHNDVGIVTRRRDRRAIADRRAVDPLQREHPLGGAIPVDGGRAISFVVAEILAQLLGGGGLEAQIHLDAHDLGEGAHGLDRLQTAEARLGALDQLGDPVEEVEVAREGPLDAGPQNLDRDITTIGGDSKVDLRDRRCRDRHIVERREQRAERLAELALDDGARLAAGKRREMILQPAEVGRDFLVEKIGAGRQRLAELDEAWTHVLQRRRQPFARPARVTARAEQPRPGDQRRRDAQGLEREQRIVPREAQRERQQTPTVAKRAEHPRDASPSAGPRCPSSCCAT